ncbi:MAG: carbon-nitrogen hydrolase [Candidatus Peribacteraceae bacterium]|nr:carbon-nitrogen hydrolase [Candidatus Peribacteraceae bacterium]
MKNQNVTIGLIQMACNKSREENLAHALKKIDEAAAKGAQIVALPELFQSHYFCQIKNDKTAFDDADEINGLTAQALSDAAKKNKIVLVGGSIFEKATDGNFYNTSIIFGPDGKTIGTYRKMHIPEDILYHEQHYFTPGNGGYDVFDTPFGKIAVLICYDQWFPEAARIVALKGAEIIFYPTAIGVIDEDVEDNITGNWQQMWTNAMLGHAATNNVYVCAINRTAKEKAITFWGGSFIADPSSKILAHGKNKDEILIAECDLSRVKALQKAWRFLDCRRPDTYGAITNQ